MVRTRGPLQIRRDVPYEFSPPDPGLAETIDGYWRLDNLVAERRYVVAPKRHVELVVNVGAPQLAGASRCAALTAYHTCWITGLRDKAAITVSTGSSLLYGVRFRDFAVPAWLSGEVERNRRWATDLESSSDLRGLSSAIAVCDSLASAAAIFDAFFLSRSTSETKQDSLATAIRQAETSGTLTPAAILSGLDAPPRRSRELAKEVTGFTLRRFARLVRFENALIALDAERSLRIADVAHDVGYYDEAHMTHNFAAFCGISPSGYRRLRHTAADRGLPHYFFRG